MLICETKPSEIVNFTLDEGVGMAAKNSLLLQFPE